MRHEFCLATFIKKLTVKKLCVWCIWFWLISVCIVKYHYTPNLLTLPKPLTGFITQRFGESCDSTHPREDCIDSDYSAGVISENNLTEEFTVNDYMKDHIFKLQRIIWKHSWSPQLYTQLNCVSKIQAWTGFEPMTSAIPVECSTIELSVRNSAREAMKAHVTGARITWISNYRYSIRKRSNWIPVIGLHLRDHAPITLQICAWRINRVR